METPLLPAGPELERLLPRELKAKLESHYDEGILAQPGARLPEILAAEYAIDIRAQYGPLPLAHPLGKASGQLSLQRAQVAADAEAGLAFVVLKTVIAEDERGGASMEAWKVKKPRMEVERIAGRRAPREGWTVSWAGRGWEGSLASYLAFMREALPIGAAAGMPVIPSCKYHLPRSPEEPFRREEYGFTTLRIVEAWRAALGAAPLVLEQDFSPTLAGTDAAQSKRLILKWLAETPALIKEAAPSAALGVKLMNALFEDEFQHEMMRLLARPGSGADFLICFNRLFDPGRAFGETKGIAYGGPDLSDRNLAILREAIQMETMERPLAISATGDVTAGATMIEYALRGATSAQAHTLFQLPASEFRLRGASRVRAAMHEIYFHPRQGAVAAMAALRALRSPAAAEIRFLDLPAIGREMIQAERKLR